MNRLKIKQYVIILWLQQVKKKPMWEYEYSRERCLPLLRQY